MLICQQGYLDIGLASTLSALSASIGQTMSAILSNTALLVSMACNSNFEAALSVKGIYKQGFFTGVVVSGGKLRV